MKKLASAIILTILLLATYTLTLNMNTAQGLSDVAPPSIVDLSFNPETIDVSASSHLVTITLHATDDLSGIRQCDIYFRSPSGNQYRSTNFWGDPALGDANDGVYEHTIEFFQYSEAGTWQIDTLRLTDKAGNYKDYSADSLANIILPNTIQVISIPDVAPPSIVDLSFNPETIDVSASSHLVTITLHATDDLSGIRQCDIYFRSPSGNQYRSTNFWGDPALGDANDGVYEHTIEFFQYSEAGTWQIDTLRLTDKAGNYKDYSADSLANIILPNTIQVISIPDVAPPSIVDLSFNPETIDVSASSHLVTITLHATDDLSGIRQCDIYFRSPSGNQYRSTNFWGDPALGDANDGVYEHTIEFFQYSEAGTWQIDTLRLTDKAGNYKDYSADSLANIILPNSIIVVPFVNVVPEVPLGTLMATLAMVMCLVAFVAYKKLA
jgi:azurin